jgi:hypothetical protein
MFAALDWTSQEFYHYLAAGGAALVVLALVLYALRGGRLRAPALVLSIVGGLGLGLGLAIIALGALGYRLGTPPVTYAYPGGIPRGMGGMAGIMAGGRSMPPEMFGGSAEKNDLAALVDKLDQMTDKPLAVRLSDAQRQGLRDQLKGLADADELSDEDAKARLDKLHDLLKDQRGTLEAAGYRWPAQPVFPPPAPSGPPPANPFKTEQHAGHLKALSERLARPEKG